MKNLELEQKRNVFGLSKDERKQIEIEQSLESLSRYLDDWIKIPVVGWRFGLDAIIGLVPNVGDSLTSLASFYFSCGRSLRRTEDYAFADGFKYRN